MTERQLRQEANNVLAKRDGICSVWHLQKAAKWQTDIFGVFDLMVIEKLPLDRGYNTFYIQLTTLSNASKRRKKIQDWLQRFELYGFPNAFLWSYDLKVGAFREENIMLDV